MKTMKTIKRIYKKFDFKAFFKLIFVYGEINTAIYYLKTFKEFKLWKLEK